MSVVRLAACALAAALLATSARADLFRMSAKAGCIQPTVSSNQKSVGFSKKSHVNTGFIADMFEFSTTEAKELDLIYDPKAAKLSVVKRCDGSVVQQLAHFDGSGTTTIGPGGGKQKIAQTVFLAPESVWGDFAVDGGISCKFIQKVEAFQITALIGVCKGTLRTFGAASCDAQFAPIGTFTPGPGCM
jgi:hypothetical protein